MARFVVIALLAALAACVLAADVVVLTPDNFDSVRISPHTQPARVLVTRAFVVVGLAPPLRSSTAASTSSSSSTPRVRAFLPAFPALLPHPPPRPA